MDDQVIDGSILWYELWTEKLQVVGRGFYVGPLVGHYGSGLRNGVANLAHQLNPNEAPSGNSRVQVNLLIANQPDI